MTTPDAPTVAPPADTADLPAGWRGPLLPVNVPSGDGRVMLLSGDIVPARPLPLAFSAQEELGEGHDGSRVVGLITRLWMENGFVCGEGPFDLADPFAADWARKLADGFAGWVSIDLSDVPEVIEVPIGPDGQPIPPEAFAAWEQQITAWDAGPMDTQPPEPPQVVSVQFHMPDWKVMGATLVSSPAFEDARVAPVYGEFTSTPVPAAVLAAAAAADGATPPAPEDGDGPPADESDGGVDEADEDEQTGAMVALVPADPAALAVDGGDPPEQLHMTLAYLGEAADWSEDQRAALVDALGDVLGAQIDGTVFGWATFNPTEDTEPDPCAVYLVNSPDAGELRDAVADVLSSTPGLPAPADNFDFIAHITAGYGLDQSALSYTGPVTFSALRVAFAGQATDLDLDTEAVAASAGVRYRADDFHQPEPDHYVDHWQVTADGAVSMHLAAWGECHIGVGDRCTQPPPGVAEYARFHRIEVDTDQGPVRVGKITMGTGHASADPSVTAGAAMAHYDNTGTLVAVVRCSDGVHGPWLSGHLVPWATPQQAQQLAHHEVSGDWRARRGQPFELVAALAVNVPGFMRSAVAASGAQVLLAAGRPNKTPAARYAAAARPVTMADVRAEARRFFLEIQAETARDTMYAGVDTRVRRARAAGLDRRVQAALPKGATE